MSQMVLPQNLSKSGTPDSSADLSSSKQRPDKAGDSRFDEVSQAERRRMDESRASKSESLQESRNKDVDRSDNSSASQASEKSPETTQDKSTETASASGDSGTSDEASDSSSRMENGDDGTRADEVRTDGFKTAVTTEKADPLLTGSEGTDPDTADVAITFAGLQSLAAPTQQAAAGMAKAASVAAAPAQANAQGNPFFQGALAAMAGVNGSGGKNGPANAALPGQSASSTNRALTDGMIAGISVDSAKSADSPLLQNAVRFQGTLDMVNQQANSLNTPKMAPESAVLRGYATSIDVPVSHSDWGDKMAGKLTWLTARNMSVAEIHLTPPDMGPMEVKVHVQQDQANITVHSANPVVREQLELHSHRLRDMLNEQGFSLEQFDVSDSGADQNQNGEAEQGSPSEGAVAAQDSDDGSVQTQSLDLTWKGEVDIFA